jgi:WD repeat-containing protein 68
MFAQQQQDTGVLCTTHITIERNGSGDTGTSSTDTTCTIWDVETQRKDALIAHDREAFDLQRGKRRLASVGADMVVSACLICDVEHSTIIYESSNLDFCDPNGTSRDPNYMATMVDSRRTIILDIRPVLARPNSVVICCVNATAWAPHSFLSHILYRW